MKGEPFRAWQPLTFGGVAQYAFDWIGRLFVTGVIVSILATAAVVFTVSRAWIPVVEQSIANLPQGAEIRGGVFRAPQTATLAENSFLSIRFDPDGSLRSLSTSEIEVTFRPDEIRFRSIFGIVPLKYPPHWTIALTPAEMEPKWGAWKPAVIGYLIGGVIANLFFSWIAFGILYTLIPRLLALFMRRHLSLWGAFKLSIAALMPGALFFTLAIALYGLGLGQIRLIEMVFAWLMHFVIGWIFLIGSVFKLPPLLNKNPFDKSEVEEEEELEKPAPKKKNPFKTKR